MDQILEKIDMIARAQAMIADHDESPMIVKAVAIECLLVLGQVAAAVQYRPVKIS